MTMLRVTDQASRAEIEAAIVVLRGRATRLSRHDPKRDAIDAEVDELVDQWIRYGEIPSRQSASTS